LLPPTPHALTRDARSLGPLLHPAGKGLPPGGKGEGEAKEGRDSPGRNRRRQGKRESERERERAERENAAGGDCGRSASHGKPPPLIPLPPPRARLDNSEWMRNGDFAPSRLEAQNDAVNVVFGAKTESNPENTVGLMTMAGKGGVPNPPPVPIEILRPQVLVSLTRDIGKVLTAMHGITLEGTPSLTNGIQVAQLVLKHRQNKNQAQRVVVFIGSPIDVEEKELVRVGKKLKKNNVAVDIVNFGEEAHNTAKLEAFIDAVRNNDNSHLVTVPPGPHVLSDLLISSPVINSDGGAPAGFGGGGAVGFEFGIDPNLDPELALVRIILSTELLFRISLVRSRPPSPSALTAEFLVQALRISLEEERARQESERVKQRAQEGGAEAPGGFAVEEPAAIAGATDDDMLAQALAMSMGHRTVSFLGWTFAVVFFSFFFRAAGSGMPSWLRRHRGSLSALTARSSRFPQTEDVAMEELTEEEQMARAVQMSIAGEVSLGHVCSRTWTAQHHEPQQDPNVLANVLGTLPGVNPDDPRIQSALNKDSQQKKGDRK
ncbi:MAG: hypothetical protein BJ554DRAFT_5741, partial [Olpidium bornovanus]